jgi:putative Mg2+ transporter-C (MgtC) family protein
MRLSLGILTGVGFIGAGAIFRQNNLVRGVTTAATLWFVSVIGLCFGGGQIGLGIAGTIIGVAALWGLKALEERLTGFGDAAYSSPRSRATQGQAAGHPVRGSRRAQ